MAELNTLSLKNDANLIAYYRLENNSNDSSVSGFNGTDTAISYSASFARYFTGASFNGTTSKILLGTHSALLTPPFTYAAWIKFTTIGTARPIIAGGEAATGGPSWYISTTGVPTLSKINIANLGNANTAITAGVWTHVAITYDAVTMRFYLNGVADGTPASTTTFTNNGMDIGFDSTQFFLGSMDDVAIFSRVLSQAEIATLAVGGPTSFGGAFLLNFI